MTQKMFGAMTAIAAVVVHGAITGAQAPAAQAPVPPPAAKIQAGDAPGYAFDITKTEIDYVLKNAPANPPDRQLRVVDMGKYNLGVGIVRRGPTNEKPGDPVPVLWHDYTPEIYYITSGAGSPDDGRRDPESTSRPGRAEHDERSQRHRHRRSGRLQPSRRSRRHHHHPEQGRARLERRHRPHRVPELPSRSRSSAAGRMGLSAAAQDDAARSTDSWRRSRQRASPRCGAASGAASALERFSHPRSAGLQACPNGGPEGPHYASDTSLRSGVLQHDQERPVVRRHRVVDDARFDDAPARRGPNEHVVDPRPRPSARRDR